MLAPIATALFLAVSFLVLGSIALLVGEARGRIAAALTGQSRALADPLPPVSLRVSPRQARLQRPLRARARLLRAAA